MGTVSTTAEFTVSKDYKINHAGPLRWIFSHALRHWQVGTIALIGAIGNSVLAAVLPVLIGYAFNVILNSPPEIKVKQLIQIAIWIGISQIFRTTLLQFGRNFGFELVAQKVERDIRDELYLSLLGKGMTFHSLQPVGEVMARATNDVREVNYFFSPGINMVAGSINFLIMPILVAPSYNPVLILTPIVFLVFYFIALYFYLKRLRPVTEDVRLSFGNLNSRLSEALDGIETVKAAAREDTEIDLFRKNAAAYRNASVKQGNIEAVFVPMLLYSIALGLGFLHSLILFQKGLLNTGDVVGYLGLLLLLDFPTYVSMWAYSQLSLGVAGARRILELIYHKTDLDQNTSGYNQAMLGEIEFRKVYFAHSQYNTKENALKNISFKIKAGQTVAIVGQTGSGKTALINLVNRIYDVNAGEVLIDGMNVKEWNLENLRKNISIIEQDIFLFSRTVFDNITFGCPGSSPGEIERAAKMAQAHDFIMEFKDGYQTVVGERGVTLSGGQRQRIALARAFLTDPRILILDDSTSAIDSATEDKIQKAIFTAAKGRTTIMITHRLSQIRWADLIIVLQKGKIVAMGKHDDLIEKSNTYRNLFSTNI